MAELALDRACLQARQELDARYGPPLGPEGLPVPLWIIGMGKLGARELNVSSDIDLIYVYEHEGETRKGRPMVAERSPTTNTLAKPSKPSTP